MNNSPIIPMQLIQRVYKIKGFDLVRNYWYENPNCKNYLTDVMMEVSQEVCEDYSDWDEGQGFGSSDFTYALKSFIDLIIGNGGLNDEFKTEFTPCLSVVKK